jgi:hypothetical protein
VTNDGVRTWYAESLADLQAMTTATRGPRNEVLRVNDLGFVFGTEANGGSGWDGVEAVYVCSAVAAGNSTWGGAPLQIPGDLDAKLRDTKYVRRLTAGISERWFQMDGDGDTAASTSEQAIMIAPTDGKVICISVRPTTAGNSTVAKMYANGVEIDSKTETTSALTVTHFIFAAAVFSKGDIVSISTTPANSMGNTPGNIVYEWDWSVF